MKNFIVKLTKYAGLIMLIAFSCAALFQLIARFGSVGGGFFPTVGALIYLIIEVALLAAIPVLVLLKRDDLIGSLSFIIVGYFLISTTFTMLSETSLIYKDAPVMSVFFGLFSLLGALALITATVFLSVAFLAKKDNFKALALYTFLIFICITVLACIFGFIYFLVENGKYKYTVYDWTSFLTLFVNYLFIPAAISFFIVPYLAESIGVAETPAAEENEESSSAEETIE